MTDRNSDQITQISTNANNIPNDSVDCGISRLGWCRGPECQKYARLRTFIVVLVCAGLAQGACETYFRVSAKQAALQNDYNPLVVEWLLVTSGIFQAVMALTYAYWAHQVHPISWLGGTIMLQGVFCVLSVIPSIINFSDGVTALTNSALDDNFCTTNFSMSRQQILTEEQSRILTLIMLFVLQIALGFGSLAFYTVGIVYLDDNSPSLDSPAAIGTIMAARAIGLQIGSSLVLGVGATNVGWWLGWVILAPCVFVSGFLLSLFPKRLPKTVVHQAAQRIIEESRSRQFGSQISTFMDDSNFGPAMKRLFGNKLLLFNLLSIMFIQSATINFALQEETYLQSRFLLPFSEEDGLLQEWKARFVSYFLKPPIMAVSILIGGLVISKMKLSGRKIAGINIGMGIKLLAIYVGFIFIRCNIGPIAGVMDGKLRQPYCSSNCICSPNAFLPVCPENGDVTFFSPCYAGCQSKTSINNVEFYDSCSCAANMSTGANLRATNGPCVNNGCGSKLILFQVLSLMAAAVMGITMICKTLITLRSVLPQDKALALALEVLLLGLFAYVPVHLAYDVITRTTCILWSWSYSSCLLRETPLHGNIINIVSASLIFIGIIFDILVFIYIKGLNMYNCKATDLNYNPSVYARTAPAEEYQPLRSEHAQTATQSAATTVTNVSSLTPSRPARPARPAPRPEITVFRNPSSLTSSSTTESNELPPGNGVTYAQVVFPPDKRKPNDGTTSPKRMIPRADVPLQHLSAEDVRGQLSNLKTFNGSAKNLEAQPLQLKTNKANLDLDEIRPQSPETDF